MAQESGRRSQDRGVEGVLSHLREYLSLRLLTVLRLAPKNAAVLPQIINNQLENLQQVLVRVKAFGTEKYRVVDILLGEDDIRRKAVLSTSDNNSILVDLLNTGGDKGKKMAEFLISDARTHITHVDPGLEKPMLLIQHYIWWDLPDAVEMHHYEEKVRTLAYVRGHRPLSEEIRGRFRASYRLGPEAPLSDAQILSNELKALEGVHFRFNLRRSEEEPYQNIMAPAGGLGSLSSADRRLAALANHIAARDSLRLPEASLSSEMAEQYAGLLGCEVEQVTRDMVLQYEEQQINNLRAGAIQDLLTGETGDTVNFKLGQLGLIRSRLESEKAAVEALGKEEG
jgi:hypothetical protein